AVQTPYTFPLTNTTTAIVPNVAVNQSGNAVAVWIESDLSRNISQCVAATLIDGIWSAPQVLSNPYTEFVNPTSCVCVSMDSSNNAVVLWQCYTRQQCLVESCRFYAGQWSGPDNVWTCQDFLYPPVLDMNTPGNILATW